MKSSHKLTYFLALAVAEQSQLALGIIKDKQQLLKQKHTVLSVGIMLSLLFSACLKDNKTQEELDAMGGPAYMSFVHASPNTAQLLVGINGERVDRQSFRFGDRLIYLSLFPGGHVFQVNSADSNRRLVVNPYSLDPGTAYTIFVADRRDSLRFVAVRDFNVHTDPPEGEAALRFINLVPDSVQFDLRMEGRDTLLAENKRFGERSVFGPVEADNSIRYKIDLLVHGTGQELGSVEFKPAPGNYYTIMAKGLMDSEEADRKVALSVLLHD